jgi:hypothetical protein
LQIVAGFGAKAAFSDRFALIRANRDDILLPIAAKISVILVRFRASPDISLRFCGMPVDLLFVLTSGFYREQVERDSILYLTPSKGRVLI